MKTKKCSVLGGILLLSLLLFVDCTESANILVVAFFTSKSHMITYMGLIEELGNRGHKITLVSPFKNFSENKNIKEIYTVDLEAIFQQTNFIYNPFESKEKEEFIDFNAMTEAATEVCRKYDVPQVKELLNEKFDLVIYEPFFNECVLGLIQQLQAPFVMFTPVGVPSTFINKLGGHLPFAFSPNIMLPFKPEMTFVERFINFGVENVLELYTSYAMEPMMEKIYREKLGNNIPSVKQILKNCSLVLSNNHFSLMGSRPYLPDVVDVGGIQSKKTKPVPKELDDFIRRGNDGFILFSMGNIKSELMPEIKRKMIVNVFSKLRQQIIWKWDSEEMLDLPKNVKLVKRLPQQDLLVHKDIKLFITHCGAGSIEESAYHGVPLVGLPMIADQPDNAKFAEQHGFIIKLDWNKLNEENFHAAINEVLNNATYRQSAKHLSTIFKDRLMDPLKLGVYWVEYIIRHKGAPHLRSIGRKLNFFQYHSYDVIGAYLLILWILSYFLLSISTMRFICRKLFCNDERVIEMNRKLN